MQKLFGRIGPTGDIHWGNSIQKIPYSIDTHSCDIININKINENIIPSWDKYFLSIAEIVKTRSKDPNTQVGTVIVDNENHIVGTGYNGMSKGFPETNELWNSKDKYDYVVHAEVNAILNSVTVLTNAKLYTSVYPCPECAKIISASGIKTVITYKENKYCFSKSENIFNLSNIQVILL